MNRAAAVLSASAVTAICTLGLAVPASATTVTPAQTEPNLPCGTTELDVDTTTPVFTVVSMPAGVTAHIRTGTTSSCSIIGKINDREAVNYHCFVFDAIGRSWTYLHTSSKEYGWVLDSTLPWGGSPTHCLS